MKNCKKYTNLENAAATYRTRSGDCNSCAFFSTKNCGAHLNPSDPNLIAF